MPDSRDRLGSAARRRARWVACGALSSLAVATVVFWSSSQAQPTAPAAPTPVVSAAASVEVDELPRLNAGYVDDQVCAQCHGEIASTYPTMGMARSFYRPDAERQSEDLDNAHYYHAPSQRHYEMVESGEGLFLHRYQLGPGGERRNERVEEVDWILGSGSNSRTYLYQTEWGELFQMPLSWYSRSSEWAMAPGYDTADHQGFQRRVQRDCMFCHNAYPPGAAGSDRHGEPQVFPQELPQGIGCQRCHGPGEDHVQKNFDLDADEKAVRDAIVQPSRLAAKRRDDVCLQCHLQTTVALSGVRHFDLPMYSFRPGQDLDDYLVYMDVVEERPKADRFEINHHPYRLQQSRCFLESPPGELSCLTCHDPHNKKVGAEATAQFRNACLSCHTVEACQLDAMGESAAESGGLPDVAADNCVACHMPRRRTQDVIEVTVTDHNIRRQPPRGDELVAPIEDVEHRIHDVVFLHPEEAPEGPDAELYRQVARVRAGNQAAVERLQSLLATHGSEAVTPYWELAVAQLGAGHFADAEKSLTTVLDRWPDHVMAKVQLSIAYAAQGRLQPASQLLEAVLEQRPGIPEAHFNLARIHVSEGDLSAAEEHFRQAIASRPNLDSAWLELGNVEARRGRYAAAAANYRQALVLNPKASQALHNLVEALVRLGQTGQAVAELRAWVFFEPDDVRAKQRLDGLTSAALP